MREEILDILYEMGEEMLADRELVAVDKILDVVAKHTEKVKKDTRGDSMILINGESLDGDTASRRISDMWADKTGAWRIGEYFDLISKFLIERGLVEEYVEFVEKEIKAKELNRHNEEDEEE